MKVLALQVFECVEVTGGRVTGFGSGDIESHDPPVTPGDSEEPIQTLLTALRDLSGQYYQKREAHELIVKIPEIPQLSLTPRDAFYAQTEVIPFKESAGRIIAEFIYVYPPGIPILLPGEVISQQNIDYIVDHVEVGLPVKGPEDRSIEFVKVIVEETAIF